MGATTWHSALQMCSEMGVCRKRQMVAVAERLRLMVCMSINCMNFFLAAALLLVVFNAHSTEAAHVYRGIRYAEPPPRWIPLGLPEPFDPIALLQRKASENVFRDGCLQFNQNPSPNATEDCFFLNIWLPDNRNVSSVNCDPAFGGCNMPVLVYIYGGGFQSGSANFPLNPPPLPNLFDGSDFADQGVRLTFLCLLNFVQLQHPGLAFSDYFYVQAWRLSRSTFVLAPWVTSGDPAT
jgi:hypothetical protein